MADFKLAWPFILEHEGGFVNNPADPGGATKYGVSLYWLKSVGDLDHDGFLDGDLNHDGRVDVADIRLLTPDTASDFYRRLWWDHYGFEKFTQQAVATKVFDTAINTGGIQAFKLLQRALNFCGGQLAVDGRMGPNTLLATNAVDPRRVLPQYCALQATFYRDLVAAKPVRAQFLKGWLKRAAWLPLSEAVAAPA